MSIEPNHQARIAELEARIAQLEKRLDPNSAIPNAVSLALRHQFGHVIMGMSLEATLIAEYINNNPIPTESINESLARIDSHLVHARAALDLLSYYMRSETYSFKPYSINELLDSEFKDGLGIPVTKQYADQFILDMDPSKIREVLTAVRKNAVAYKQGEGPITLQTAADGGYIVISISSPGRFLDDHSHPFTPADEIDKIFLPGYTQEPGKNFGMELAFARKYVDAHNGSIRAYDDAVRGAVIEIKLPLTQDVKEKEVGL